MNNVERESVIVHDWLDKGKVAVKQKFWLYLKKFFFSRSVFEPNLLRSIQSQLVTTYSTKWAEKQTKKKTKTKETRWKNCRKKFVLFDDSKKFGYLNCMGAPMNAIAASVTGCGAPALREIKLKIMTVFQSCQQRSVLNKNRLPQAVSQVICWKCYWGTEALLMLLLLRRLQNAVALLQLNCSGPSQ